MRRPEIAGPFVGVVLCGTIIVVVWIVGGQIIDWLKNGYWTEYPISLALLYQDIRPQPVAWVGVQKIIDFFLNLHVGFLVVLLAWPLVYAAYWFGMAVERMLAPLPPRRNT